MAKVHLAEIVQHGQEFVIPEGITLDTAIALLERRKKYDEEVTEISETFQGFIWDAALAFNKAMQKAFGWATAEPTPGMFGDTPPKLIAIEIGLNETAMVPWGTFSLPGISGHVQTGGTHKDGQVCFVANATVRRKHEKQMKALFKMTAEILKTESIYKGKAFKLRLKGDDGDPLSLPMPKFIDVGRIKESELIFSEEVKDAIETSLFTPVENRLLCIQHKVPLKRGILLYGPYGTGKTLAAYVTAKKCTENGWTFLYCERADELADMVKLSHFYQPAVVFCEDIDRVVSGERSVAMDDILNIIDGIESKGTELMVILTTNHVENINKALLRPGRLDAVIHVLPPDAVAVEQLLRMYGRNLIPENADLIQVSRLLSGTIPAVIRECAERAKLSQIKLGVVDGKHLIITPEALLDAARGMKNQLDLLAEAKPSPSNNDLLGQSLAEVVKLAVAPVVSEMSSELSDIKESVC